MRKLTIAAIAAIVLAAAPVAANAQNFLLGMVVGGMLFGGNSQQYSGGAALVLYSASEEDLKKIDPMSVRQIAEDGCFAKDYDSFIGNMSLADLFAAAVKKLPAKQRQIIQIIRVFHPGNSVCASIWFTYIEN
jgi:hypothetical protein